MLGDLLTQTVTVLHRSEGAIDEYGNPAEEWDDGTVYRGRLEHSDGVETSGDSLVITSRFLLIMPPDAVVAAGDRVIDEDGVTYEVDGPPIKHRTPRGVNHIEARLAVTEAI